MMSAAASVIVTVASLLIARVDGFGSFGMFVALQAIGVLLGIPMLLGVHVNASRAMAARNDGGAVAGTALAVVTGASLLVSAGYLGLLALVPVPDAARLWPAAAFGASVSVMSLAESLLRIRGRQLPASGLRLACAAGYLLALIVVLAGGHGDAGTYAMLLAGGNAACAALMLIWLRPAPRWDAGLARILLREGWVYSTGQSLLLLLFGFDVILLMQASGPAAVAVYALYIGSCRRVIGVLFTDSLASLLIASLSRTGSASGGRAALRHVPRLLGPAAIGASGVILASLAAADALHRLVAGWVVLAAIGCSAHALVFVLFCVFTVQPALGLARMRTALTAAFLPGLALQAAGAALGGVLGMIAAFAALNVALAWWFFVVIRRSPAVRDAVAGP
jgi:O-antigen/teichoic acid export membrane protein